jgi:pimeloyl-ACP methyl ester carboxylesterase
MIDPGVSSERLAVRGGEIHLLRAGAGAPLLFLHPAGGGAWRPFHGLLAERFEVIAPEHPGWGASDDLPELTTALDLAFHYAEVLDRLALDRVLLVGSSFGGWVAAELAMLVPDRIERLVLIDAIGLRMPEAPVADLFAMSPQETGAALFHDPAAAAAMFAGEPDLDRMLAIYRDQTAFARFAWHPFCNDPKLAGRLHRITAPTLCLWGEHDPVVPRAHGERYAELIAGARLEVVADTAHAPLLERPEATVAAITDFLEA